MENILLLPATGEMDQRLNLVVTMLVGGFHLEHGPLELRLIALEENQNVAKSVHKKVKRVVDEYKRWRDSSHSEYWLNTELKYNDNFFFFSNRTAIGNGNDDLRTKLGLGSAAFVDDALCWLTALYGNFTLPADDYRIVAYCHSSDFSTLAIPLAMVSRGVDKQRLRVVIEIDNDNYRERTLSCVDFYNQIGIKHVVVERQPGFGCLLASSLLLENLQRTTDISGVLSVGSLEMMHYEACFLPSKASAQAFHAMQMVRDIIVDVSSDSLKKWRERAGINGDVKTIINNSWLWKSVKFYVQCITLLNNFHTPASESKIKEVKSKLNIYKFLIPQHPTDAQIREALVSSIIDTVKKFNSKWVEDKFQNGLRCSYRNSTEHYKECVEYCFENMDFGKTYSPTALCDITDMAFDSVFGSNRFAKQWRSACLDMWQMFFRESKETVEDCGVSVIEDSVTQYNADKLLPILRQTEAGEALISQDVFYRIEIKGNPCALSSPLTGFAFSLVHSDGNGILVEGYPYFSSADKDVKDLHERDDDFRKFMYAYCSHHGASLSKRFRDYVSYSVRDILIESQSVSGNMVGNDCYPQFMKHIGIDLL